MQTTRTRAGVGLPTLMIVTILIAAAAVLIAISRRQARQQALVHAARTELESALSAVERYQHLYGALPERLGDLDRVGYHERNGMIFCAFDVRRTAAGGAVRLVVKHRASDTAVRGVYPGSDSIKTEKGGSCTSVRQ